MFDFPPAAQQDTFFEVQDFKGRVLIFVFPWGCGQDLENRIGWRSDQNVHETASHLCDFHPWFPSHEAWISLISFSEHLEFWKVTKITLHSEKVWFILQPHVKHCYFFFLLGVFHEEGTRQGTHFGRLQWSSRLWKPVGFKHIPKGVSELNKTSQNLFSSASCITIPQS